MCKEPLMPLPSCDAKATAPARPRQQQSPPESNRVTQIRLGSTWRPAPGFSIEATGPDRELRHIDGATVTPSEAVRGACAVSGWIRERYVFGAPARTFSYRASIRIDFTRRGDVRLVVIRGLRFPALSGVVERILYTS